MNKITINNMNNISRKLIKIILFIINKKIIFHILNNSITKLNFLKIIRYDKFKNMKLKKNLKKIKK